MLYLANSLCWFVHIYTYYPTQRLSPPILAIIFWRQAPLTATAVGRSNVDLIPRRPQKIPSYVDGTLELLNQSSQTAFM